ncbi:MAG: hypothetical protein ACKO0Z_21230 [Betaproteobacteria bacterium]
MGIAVIAEQVDCSSLVTSLKTSRAMHEVNKQTQNLWAAAPMTVAAADIRVEPELKRRIVRSLDRFAEYSEIDMEWAEPLGLAEWVEIDAIVLRRCRDIIERKLCAGR